MTLIKNVISFSAIIFCFLVYPLFADTYYVATDGSDEWDGLAPAWDGEHGPFATIQKAASVVNPGDTVLIKAGEYFIDGELSIDRAGTADNWITYKAYGDGEVIITNAVIMPGPWTHVQDSIYETTFPAYWFPGLPSSTLHVFHNEIAMNMAGDRNPIDSIDNMIPNSCLVVGDTYYVWLKDGSNPSDSTLRRTESHAFRLNDCHYNIFDGLTFQYCRTAIGIGSLNTHHVIVRNCTFRLLHRHGLQPVAKDCIIENNLFQIMGIDKYHHGIYTGGTSSSPRNGIIIRDNIFEGISGSSVHYYRYGGSGEIYGNIFRKPRPLYDLNNRWDYDYYVEVVAWGSGNHKIHNNLFYGDGKRLGITANSINNQIHNNTFLGTRSSIWFYSGQSGTEFKSNIVVDANLEFVNGVSGSSSQDIDYNIYFNFSAEPNWVWDGIAYSDFAAYQTASGESNSIYAEPLFVDANNGDYHLQWDSVCINAGDPTYVAGANDLDIDFEPRVMGGRVDMGADEVGPQQADLTRDGIINLDDFTVFSQTWRSSEGQEQWYILCDLAEDGQIDTADLAEFVSNWLWQADWYE